MNGKHSIPEIQFTKTGFCQLPRKGNSNRHVVVIGDATEFYELLL